MKSISVFFALVVFLAGIVCAKDVRFDDASVAFVVPDVFTELTKEEITAKYPSVNAPSQVIGDDRRTTTIAYQVKAQAVKSSDLPEVQKAFTQVFDRVIPGIEWKQNAIIDLAGQKWLMLEMTSRAIDQDIHNIVLVTSHKGRMLMFNFNSTKKEFPKVEKLLRDSIQSITLKP